MYIFYPNTETCIHSTLNNVRHQAEKLKIPTPCITFDQLLWLKAVSIVKAKGIGIVCRLGGFHKKDAKNPRGTNRCTCKFGLVVSRHAVIAEGNIVITQARS